MNTIPKPLSRFVDVAVVVAAYLGDDDVAVVVVVISTFAVVVADAAAVDADVGKEVRCRRRGTRCWRRKAASSSRSSTPSISTSCR